MEPFFSLALDDAEDMGYAIQAKKCLITSMWRAVIVRGIRDALAIDQDDQRPFRIKRNQTDALSWFYDGGSDFRRVCEYAELDPDHVQYAVLNFLTDPKQDSDSFKLMIKRTPGSYPKRNVKQMKEAA